MGEITLQKALLDYKTIYMPYRNFADRTREEYTNDLEDFVRFLEAAGISIVGEIGLPAIQRYVANLEEREFGSLTRKRKVVAVRSFLLFLYQDEYIHSNISAKIIVPFAETTTPHVLTETECEQLRDVCAANSRDAAIIEVLLQTGIRLSELTRLTLNDIEGVDETAATGKPAGFVRIVGCRARKERSVALGFAACLLLRKYLSVRNGAKTAVLFLNRFGVPLGERGVQKMFRKYLERARIGTASIHTLRHTFGAKQMAEGRSLKAIQEVMGNKDRRSTSIYAPFASIGRITGP